MRCIIIYQKVDGTKFIRTYNYDYGKKIGDETAMGWKILNVLYEYENNYYQYNKYIRIIKNKLEKEKNKKKIRKTINRIIINKLETKLKKLQKKYIY